VVAEIPKINPTLMQTFFRDLSEDEQGDVLTALEIRFPGRAASDLWRKFQCDQAVALIMRDLHGAIAVISFYELNRASSGDLEFFIRGAMNLQPSLHATEKAFPQYDQYARFFKCQSMAFQTERAGLVRKVESMPGWTLDAVLRDGQFLMRKVL